MRRRSGRFRRLGWWRTPASALVLAVAMLWATPFVSANAGTGGGANQDSAGSSVGTPTVDVVRAPVSRLYGPVPVLDVVDGDTIVVLSNVGPRTVRLIGIDAPERTGGGPFGAPAAAYLRSLAPPGSLVWLELDLGLEDIYGRLLAYAYAAHADGGWSVAGTRVVQLNLAMAEAGWAHPLTIAPNDTYADLYEAATEAAQAAALGQWARAGQEAAPAEAPPADAQPADQGPPIALHCALPSPDTPNDVGEWVSVFLPAPLDTRGYYLFDEGSRQIFRLPAGVQPAGELRIENPGQGVWNNSGDTIYLMLGGAVVDSWRYTRSDVVQGRIICRE